MASIDALFTDVYEVQKELEKFGAKRLVDACDIFKLLDTHSLRSDRVQFVTTHLLVRLGLRSNFGEEDIINVPDVLNDPEECNTSHVAEKVQLIDHAIKSTSSATDTKQPDIWKESSTSTSNASAEWNILYMTGITGGIEIASTANDNIQTKPIVVSDDFALKTDTSESSRPGWEVAKPGTSQADVPAGVHFLLEETSFARVHHKCNVCYKTFKDKSNFRKHKRIHTGHRPYSCNQCPKAYGDRTALKQHLRMHSGDRPYACNVCGKGLFSKFNLTQHYQRVHNLFK